MRTAALPVGAGTPPADAAQPSGMNGMIVRVPMTEKTAPRAPRIPSSLFQNPRNRSAQNDHSDTPRNQVAPRMPSNGYSQKMSGPWLMNGINTCASYSNHF